LLDLLLDADGGAGDELLPILVDQEDGTGVGVEDLTDARQQHLQQLVELEVREGDVGDRLQALEARPRGALRLEQARVVDRDGGPVARALEQLDVVVAEDSGRERPDVQYAHHLVVRDHRDAAERLDPLLPQQRVEDVGVVDVVEDDRPPVGGDSAREALPERNADAALDLLLDADGGAGDELALPRVEQQDRARVRRQEIVDSLEQRAEQLLELQVDQRGVGQRLKTREPGVAVDPLHRTQILIVVAGVGQTLRSRV
jgi:hypothetical protein